MRHRSDREVAAGDPMSFVIRKFILYSKRMRGTWIVWLLLARIAYAQPSSTPISDPKLVAFEDCKTRRRTQELDAFKIRDLYERRDLLVKMPICERLPDGSVSVIVPPAEPVDTSLFTPHADLAVKAGISSSSLLSGLPDTGGTAPFFELEAGYRMRSKISVGVFAGYSSFHDTSAARYYDVREWLYDVGARFRLHVNKFSFGAGLGIEIERSTGYAAIAPYTKPLALVEVHADYAIAKLDSHPIELNAIVTEAHGAGDTVDGDLISARFAVGLRL